MIDVVRTLFFPALGAGVVCCLAWRRLPDRSHGLGLLLAGAGLFAIPQFIVILAGTASTGLLLHRQVVIGIWLSLIGAFVAWKAPRILPAFSYPNGRWRYRRAVIFGIVAALAFGVYGLNMVWLSAQDLLLPHTVYQDRITRKWIGQGTGLAPQYYLVVDDRSVKVGRDLYTRARVGEPVTVEVTAASQTVVRVRLGFLSSP